MSIRTFLFCDVCNPRGIRTPEQRRDMHRRDTYGRRISDGRSWFEGDLDQAKNENWVAHDDGSYVCPNCTAKGLQADHPNSDNGPRLRSFVFCDLCNPQGFRVVESRRNEFRANASQTGRRITDGRAWLDTTTTDYILKKKWKITDQGKHYCPNCLQRHPDLTV